MKSNGFVSKFITGSVLALMSSVVYGMNPAQQMAHNYFQQIFRPHDPNRAYGVATRPVPSPYSHRPRPNPKFNHRSN